MPFLGSERMEKALYTALYHQYCERQHAAHADIQDGMSPNDAMKKYAFRDYSSFLDYTKNIWGISAKGCEAVAAAFDQKTIWGGACISHKTLEKVFERTSPSLNERSLNLL